MSKIGHVFDPRYLLHQPGASHPERPERLTAIEEMIEKSHLKEKLRHIAARRAEAEEIALVHDRHYIDAVARTSEMSGVYLDGDTFASPGSYEAALLAAGGVLEAVDRVMAGDCQKAFAMVRPPGHHAESRYAMGFCLFNNVGVAAEYLVKKYRCKRIAVVDFDVHHGNATQHMFYDRPDVFYLSTHRYPFYPGTGAAEERGTGAGKGYTLNVPMAAGGGDEDYREAFEEKLIPALREYRPEVLLVSAGFDAHRLDPLGGMRVTEAGFGAMTERLAEVAGDFCGGKAVFTLEGGYDLQALAGSVKRVLEVLLEK
jgi:acetoin utilization deacetylase AcuC-like enzyme